MNEFRLACVFSVLGLFLTASVGCGDAAAPPAEREGADRQLQAEGPPLTRTRPQVVKRDCHWLAVRSEEEVFCPRLVPSGTTYSQQPYSEDSYYSANFVSASLAGQRHHGHWSFEAGTPQQVRSVLRTNSSGPLHLVGRISTGTVPIQLFEIGRVQNIHQDHLVARWLCEGRAFVVSVHGLSNQDAAEAMASDLLDLIADAGACSPAVDYVSP